MRSSRKPSMRWGWPNKPKAPQDGQWRRWASYEEAQKCTELFHDHVDQIDGIIICLTNFGEETGIADAIKWSKCDVPILI